MSLKAFHIVFIIFSTLLALGTAAWCVWVDLVVAELVAEADDLAVQAFVLVEEALEFAEQVVSASRRLPREIAAVLGALGQEPGDG